MIRQARQAEIQMLRQIDALQQGINRSIDQQVEGIRTGGMSNADQRQYYQEQITAIMGQLRGGTGSPEELQQWMADLQRYVGLMQGSLGDRMYESIAPWGGDTWADYLVGILEEARGLSNTALEEMRDQIQATNEALINELQLLILALTDFTGMLADPEGDGGGGKNINIPVEVNVNIEGNQALFVREVRAIVHAEMNRRQAIGGLPAPHGVS